MANKIWVSEQRLGYYHGKLVTLVEAKDAAVLAAAKEHAEGYANGLAGNYEAAGSVATAQQALEALISAEQQRAEGIEGGLAERLTAAEGDIGTVENLQTTAKADLVSAINEVKNSVAVGGTAAVVSMSTETTTEGALKSYSLFQGENKIGTIDIPKDMVVESGEVVTNPEGQAEGTYIKLVLANVAEPLYINVGTLVDIYKAKANAAQVQVTIDTNTREISAAIVAGSIGTTELADDAVVTAKIADNNVTKAKLSTAVQASLDKADAAAPQTALDAEIERAGKAEAKALEDAKAYADGLDDAMDARMLVVEGKAHEHANAEELAKIAAGDKAKWDTAAGKAHEHANAEELAKIASGDVAKWNAAEQNAKDYADGLVEGIALGDIATNKAAIEALQGTHATDKAALEKSISDLEASFVEITEAQIDAWFTA